MLSTCSRPARLALACAISGIALSSTVRATAQLTYDLRVSDTGAKTATVAAAGDVVTMNLYAIIAGADSDPANDGFHTGQGSFLSGIGGLKGDLSFFNLDPFAFTAATKPGVQRDLDGDGDLDVGGLGQTAYDGQSYFVSGTSPVMGMPAGGFLLGQLKFVVTSSADSSTSISFLPRIMTVGTSTAKTPQKFTVDGVYKQEGGQSENVGLGAPVVITLSAPPIVIGDGSVITLSGTINEHVKVAGKVIPAAGSTVIVNKGLDIVATGVADLRDSQGAYGSNEVRVDDLTSGNVGGSLFVNKLKVGNQGTGRFEQTAGVTVTGNELSMGVSSGSNGTFICGGGSVITPILTVGTSGAATFVQTGGTVNAGTLDISMARSASGAYELRGGTLNVTGTRPRIGAFGNGAFRQSGGDSVFPKGIYVGYDGSTSTSPAVTGTLELSGGTITVDTTTILLGFNGGNGNFVQTGGEVNTLFFSVGCDATPIWYIERPSIGSYVLDAGKMNVKSIMSVGNRGGGTVVQSGGELKTDQLFLNGAVGYTTKYTLSGGALSARLETNGNVFRQVNGVHDVGSMTISSTGVYEYLGGTLDISKQLVLKGKFDFLGSNALLSVGANAFADFSKGTILNAQNASITGEAGSLISFPATFNPLTQLAHISTAGLVHFDGQPLNVPANQKLAGSGTITGDVSNAGLLSPGNSPGQLIVEGNFTQSSSASVLIELAGTAAEDFDSVSITGNLSLDGTLAVSLLDGFVPGASDQFVIFTAGSLTGVFANAPSTITIPEGEFDVIYSPTSVTLADFQPAPEPASVAIIGAVAAIALSARRRRH